MDLLIWQLAPDVICFKARQLCQACEPSPQCGIKLPMSPSLYFTLSWWTEGDSGCSRSLLCHILITSPVGCLFLYWDFGFGLLLAMWHLCLSGFESQEVASSFENWILYVDTQALVKIEIKTMFIYTLTWDFSVVHPPNTCQLSSLLEVSC